MQTKYPSTQNAKVTYWNVLLKYSIQLGKSQEE